MTSGLRAGYGLSYISPNIGGFLLHAYMQCWPCSSQLGRLWSWSPRPKSLSHADQSKAREMVETYEGCHVIKFCQISVPNIVLQLQLPPLLCIIGITYCRQVIGAKAPLRSGFSEEGIHPVSMHRNIEVFMNRISLRSFLEALSWTLSASSLYANIPFEGQPWKTARKPQIVPLQRTIIYCLEVLLPTLGSSLCTSLLCLSWLGIHLLGKLCSITFGKTASATFSIRAFQPSRKTSKLLRLEWGLGKFEIP